MAAESKDDLLDTLARELFGPKKAKQMIGADSKGCREREQQNDPIDDPPQRPAQERYTREERLKHLKDKLEPLRLQKFEVKKISLQLWHVLNTKSASQEAISLALLNLDALEHFPVAERYALDCDLPQALYKFTYHPNKLLREKATKVVNDSRHMKWCMQVWNALELPPLPPEEELEDDAYPLKPIIQGNKEHPPICPQFVMMRTTVGCKVQDPPTSNNKRSREEAGPSKDPRPSKHRKVRHFKRVERLPPPPRRPQDAGTMYIGCDSSNTDIVKQLKAACRKLKGAKACVSQMEDRVTHYIMGKHERTISSALAVCNGAVMLCERWLEASLAYKYWVLEMEYLSQTEASVGARNCNEVEEAGLPKPLDGVLLCVANNTGNSGWKKAGRLETLGGKLGAELVSSRSCTVCICGGGARLASNLPQYAKLFQEQWLLDVAFKYEAPRDLV